MKSVSSSFWLTAAAVVLLGCSSSDGGGKDGGNDAASDSGGGASSGLPRGTRIGDIPAAQRAPFCDWVNGKQGGYGRSVTCTNGADQGTDPNQGECLGGIPQFTTFCPTLTVGDVEDCVNTTGADLCKANVAAECTAVLACSG